MTTRIEWRAQPFMAQLRSMSSRVDNATRDAVRDGTMLIQRKAQQNSSGRPGPNVRSGAHRAGILTVGPIRVGNTWEGRVTPTRPYSRALELGHPRWPPGVKYPYLGPALAWARRGPIAALFREAWGRVHRG